MERGTFNFNLIRVGTEGLGMERKAVLGDSLQSMRKSDLEISRCWQQGGNRGLYLIGTHLTGTKFFVHIWDSTDREAIRNKEHVNPPSDTRRKQATLF